MKHVAAYLLCVLGGNATPTAADVQAVLKAGDIEADTESLDRLIKSMEGKSIDEVLEAGKEKLSKFGGGGGGGGGGGAAAAAEEEKEEEEEEEEEVDMGGGAGLFGDDDDY